MIGCFHVAPLTQITGSGLCPRFIFSVLFPPLDLVVAPLTRVDVWQRQDFLGFLAAWIVLEGKFVLVGRGASLFLFCFVPVLVPGRHR